MRVLTIGTFDCPHAGHAIFISKIRKLFPNAEVVVALNTDEFVARFKRYPMFSLEERGQLIKHLADTVVENRGDEDSRQVVLEVKPDVIAIGSDWFDKDYRAQTGITGEFLEHNNISLVYIPHTYGISTTDIIKRIKDAEPN